MGLQQHGFFFYVHVHRVPRSVCHDQAKYVHCAQNATCSQGAATPHVRTANTTAVNIDLSYGRVCVCV